MMSLERMIVLLALTVCCQVLNVCILQTVQSMTASVIVRLALEAMIVNSLVKYFILYLFRALH